MRIVGIVLGALAALGIAPFLAVSLESAGFLNPLALAITLGGTLTATALGFSTKGLTNFSTAFAGYSMGTAP